MKTSSILCDMRHQRTPDTCFACSDSKTTAEHVPAKVFFPEEKDTGIKYREQLVTVPACKAHNGAYSKDDEYAAYAIQAHHNTNKAATQNFNSKILRALARNDRLQTLIYSELRPVFLPDKMTGKLRRVHVYNVNQERINRVMCRIAAALYFRLTGMKTTVDPDNYYVYSPDALSQDGYQKHYSEEYDNLLSRFTFSPLRLWHPDVFFCDYHIEPQRRMRFSFRYTFYGNVRYRVVNK